MSRSRVSADSGHTHTKRLCRKNFGILTLLFALLLPACAPGPGSPVSIPSAPHRFETLVHHGTGYSVTGSGIEDAQARRFAFAAALAMALGDAALPRHHDSGQGSVLAESLSGQAGPYLVWRQRAASGASLLSDVVLVEHSQSMLIATSGRLERLDPDFPLPDWRDPDLLIAGLHVQALAFEQSDGRMRCLLTLGPQPPDTPLPLDGLVVDARLLDYSPARVLRLLDQDGTLVYAPEMVAADVIVLRGMAAFTTTAEKAEALLGAMGSHRPVTARAIAVRADGALVLSGEGAAAARKADETTRIFENARVVVLIRGAH